MTDAVNPYSQEPVPPAATPTPVVPENVGRGALFALGAIPIAIVVFGILGYLGVFPFIVGIATPFIASWLYTKGSGGQLTKRGWPAFMAISLVAVVLGALASVFAAVFEVYGRSSQFTNALLINLRSFNIEGGGGFTIALAIVLGIVGIFAALGSHGRAVKAAQAGTAAAPAQQPVSPFDAPVAPNVEVTGQPPAPAQPSPGVSLNGEPIDPNAPRA